MAEKRFIGDFPKIGIRPTVDGRRRGVRESIEPQALNLAKVVANLLSSTLKYPNGEAVQCVVADTCIGGVAEAAACAEKFKLECVVVSITSPPTFFS